MTVTIINPLSKKQDIDIVLRSPFRTRALRLYLIAIVIFLYRSINDPAFLAHLHWDLFVTAMLILVGFMITRIPIFGPPIQLREDRLRLPYKVGSSKYCDLSYSELRSFEVRGGSGSNQYIVIDTPSRTIAYPRSAFPSRVLWQVFIQEVFGRIAELDGGGAQLVEMEQRARRSIAVLSRRPLVTMLLLAVTAIIFLLELLYLPQNDPIQLAGWGANSSRLVLEGEWYRLVSSGFLHVGFLHFALNFVAFFSLGYLIEAMFGAARFLIIFTFSLLAASYASVLSGHALSVGISGAVFGLLGALAILQLSLKELPAGFRMTLRWWYFVLITNGAIPLLVPAIDMAAHVGGFVAGAFLTKLLLWLTPSQTVRAASVGRFRASLVDILSLTAFFVLLWGVGSAIIFGSDNNFRDASIRKVVSDAQR